MKEMKVLAGLLYTKDHEWIRVKGDTAEIGITDYAQCHLGDIVYVELPEVGDSFDQGSAFGSVESTKTAADVNMPAGGTVEEVNESLSNDPALLNSDSYANWLIRVKLADASELEGLMDAEAYKIFSTGEA